MKINRPRAIIGSVFLLIGLFVSIIAGNYIIKSLTIGLHNESHVNFASIFLYGISIFDALLIILYYILSILILIFKDITTNRLIKIIPIFYAHTFLYAQFLFAAPMAVENIIAALIIIIIHAAPSAYLNLMLFKLNWYPKI